MTTKRGIGRRVALAVGTDPPTEFRLFRLGENPTEKGTFILDENDAQACLDAHAAYANDLSIDWGHAAFNEADGVPHGAAGWIAGLELRADGLWAVGVTWTPRAAEMLLNREQRYYSPAFEVDDAGHIRKVINCALTLIPATHDLTPLVASRLGGTNPVSTTRKTNMADKFCKAGDLAALADEFEKMGETFDGAKSMAAKLRELAEGGVEIEVKPHDEPDGDEKPAATADDTKDAEKMADDDGEDDEKMADDAEDKVAASIAALAREITGGKSAAEVKGALRALAESKNTNERLSKRLADVERTLLAKDVAELVAKASKAGKLSPAQKDWAIKLGMKDIAELRAFVASAPVQVKMSGGEAQPTPAPEAPTSSIVTLSDVERDICRKAGVPEDKYLADKARRQSA